MVIIKFKSDGLVAEITFNTFFEGDQRWVEVLSNSNE